jgi:hypothetical protein
VRRWAAAGVALLAAAAVALVLVAVLGGGGDGHRTGARVGARAAQSIVVPPRIYPYPASAVRDFMGACVRSAPAEERTCRCVVDDLQTRLPYADFAAADAAARRGRPLPPRARIAIDASTRECRRAAS